MRTYRVYQYDVWGNEEDGFNVNDIFRTSDTFEVGSDDPSSEEIIAAMWASNLCDHPNTFSIDWNGDDSPVYISSAKNGKPLGELRLESEEG